MPAALDLKGKRFGRLSVISLATPGQKPSTGFPVRRWNCRCDCGTRHVVATGNLRSGEVRSCGCLQAEIVRTNRRTHGHTANHRTSREYRAWQGAKKRCTNPRAKSYQDYGGRGIRMCSKWMRSFEAFLRDMGRCPPRRTLDRFPNNDGHYESGNCRWATPAQQNSNKRTSQFVRYNGQRMTITEASGMAGIMPQIVVSRLKSGWSVTRALSVPVRHRK